MNAKIFCWIAVIWLFTIAMCCCQGIGLDANEILVTSFSGVGWLAASYLFRKTPFGTFLSAMAVLNFFPTAFVLAMNLVATTSRPLADGFLAQLDMGVAPRVHGFVKSLPYLDAVLEAIYSSASVQTTLAVLFLTATRQPDRMQAFLLRLILGCLVTVVGFYWLPAMGTVSIGLSPPDFYEPIAKELLRLRAGVDSVNILGSQGIVTFPSFHTIWAVILIAVYHRSSLFWPMLIVNGLMLVSTLTVGMHYFSDLIGGLLVCAAIIPATRLLRKPE